MIFPRALRVAFLFLMTGCAMNPIQHLLGEMQRRKIAVVCTQSNQETNQRFEDYMVRRLTAQGFQAVGTRTLFAPQDEYFQDSLIETLRGADIGAIAEVSYRGALNAEGAPESYDLHYVFLPSKEMRFANQAVPGLDVALAKLIIQLKTHS